MPRPERPIDPSWPFASFASGLRALRNECGLTYQQMSLKVHFCKTTLSSAANGWQLPTLPVTLAYVRACNGPEGEWRVLWQQARDLLQSQNGRNHG